MDPINWTIFIYRLSQEKLLLILIILVCLSIVIAWIFDIQERYLADKYNPYNPPPINWEGWGEERDTRYDKS